MDKRYRIASPEGGYYGATSLGAERHGVAFGFRYRYTLAEAQRIVAVLGGTVEEES